MVQVNSKQKQHSKGNECKQEAHTESPLSHAPHSSASCTALLTAGAVYPALASDLSNLISFHSDLSDLFLHFRQLCVFFRLA